MAVISKLLVANRGEIACRIMRTAGRLGMKTVAVHSDSDRNNLHVRIADQVVSIGPPAPSESYLSIERILEAAKKTGADAIHPGYGFLSENAAFADACQDAGVIFVGPPAKAIRLMGDKARAKGAMNAAQVPCIPGYQGEQQDTDTLTKEARRVGFPLMIKAAAGGGGRGMRLVRDPSGLTAAIETARSEAINAFGAGELLLERAIVRPRHVEIQVFGDRQGNVVYLGERDCSVQRRHQKVIEEAPCPVMTPQLRARMGQAAVLAARAVDYVGAGTVEFLLDKDQSFYFLEMNTRLQVEHPVTEAITGLDLVELQLKVAAGEPLGFSQEEVVLNGHAIEARLYAEDPGNGFLPVTGLIRRWHAPRGPGIRVDAGVDSGSEVSPFYDPLLAKVIASGKTREEARRRLMKSLGASSLVGPATNRDFLIDALGRETFRQAKATTAFIEEEYGQAGFRPSPSVRELAMAALTHYRVRRERALSSSPGVNRELLDWSGSISLMSRFIYGSGDESVSFVVSPTGPDSYVVQSSDGSKTDLRVLRWDNARVTIRSDAGRQVLTYFAESDDRRLHIASDTLEFTVRDMAGGEPADDGAGDGVVVSPMQGRLLEVYVSTGDRVAQGQRLGLLEAMKMQQEIVAQVSGRVAAIHLAPGVQVGAGTPIMEIEPMESGGG